jgi:crotonobetainyl-CoA:carnitine CoA-transferase CaiB-like acyl-CoA transferase
MSAMKPDLHGPLVGVRVLDITTAWAGPFAGRVLAYLGAEVIHVESATRLDLWRGGGHAVDPIRYPDGIPGDRPYNRNLLFNSQNANKLSFTVDIKKPGGSEALLKLALACDVVLCNFTPGTLTRMGLNPKDLLKQNSRLIVLEMPAFGNSGPMAHHGALGPSMEFGSGMSSFIGHGAGQPSSTQPAYLDPIGGYNAASSIMTALAAREASGKGQIIELSQVEAAMPFIGEYILDSIENGRDPEQDGNHVAYAAPHDAFPTNDEEGWVAIGVTSDAEWQSFCKVIGRTDLADDPRYATMDVRLKNQNDLYEPIATWTKARGKYAIADQLQAAGVPAAAVQTGKDITEDPYLLARGFFVELEHPEAGRRMNQRLPFRLSQTPGGQVSAAPLLGEHNDLILREYLGLSDAEIKALEQAGTTSNVLP